MCKCTQQSTPESKFLHHRKRPISIQPQSNQKQAYAKVYPNEPV